MHKVPALTDMASAPESIAEGVAKISTPAYPYGLCISLTNNEIEKLNLDIDDVEIGDVLHIHALAKVTSISCNKSENGSDYCRIELQITHMTPVENESEEDDQAETVLSKLYR